MIVSVLFTDVGGDLSEILVLCPYHGGADLASLIIRAIETALRHSKSSERGTHSVPSLEESQLCDGSMDGRDHTAGKKISLVCDPIRATACTAPCTRIAFITAFIHGLGRHGRMAATFRGELLRGTG